MKNLSFSNARAVFEQPFTRLLQLGVLSFFLMIAASTLLMMAGLRWSISFSTIAWLIVFSTLAIGAAAAWAAARLYLLPGWSGTDRICLFVTMGICLCTATLGASINRPDLDDSIYVPKAVFYTENPAASLDRLVTWIAVPDSAPASGVFPYYELMQAAFSLTSKTGFLDFYHVLFPGIVGALIFLSAFLLIGIFEQRRIPALLTAVFLFLLLLVLGETHRSYGNLSIARAFHGKYMFLSVGMPSWVFFSLRFLVLRDRLSWIALVVLGVAMAGTTTTAMVFLPLLSFAIAASYYVNEGQSIRSVYDLKPAAIYCAALVPVLAMALDFRSYAISHIGAGSAVNAGFPRGFWQQMQLLVNPDHPVTPLLAALALIAVAFFSGYRRFFLSWTVIVIVLLFNPLVSEFVIKNITTENIYWRLFYLLPFPIIAGVAFAGLIKQNRGSRLAVAILFAVVIPAAIWGPTSVLRPENGATLELSGYKIGRRDLAAARHVIDRAAPGTMFAPLELSGNILLLSSRFPQFHVREDYLGLMLRSVGQTQEFEARIKAYAYLYEQDVSPEAKAAFFHLIEQPGGPRHVVVRTGSVNHAEIVRKLFDCGYQSRLAIDDRYQLFSAAGSCNRS